MDEKPPIGSEDRNTVVGEGLDFAIQQKMPGCEALDDLMFLVRHKLANICDEHWYCRARIWLVRSAFDSLLRFRVRAGKLAPGRFLRWKIRALSALFTIRALFFQLLSLLLPRHEEV